MIWQASTSRFRLYLIVVALIAYAVSSYFFEFIIPKNSTDPEDGRSGLWLYTDSLTGCQYLKGGFAGGLTPRVAADGKNHTGCRNQSRIDDNDSQDAQKQEPAPTGRGSALHE